ncbi:MAG TPA: isocitrate lyase/phosphoenolpyruvate mutase family protein [Candidatus Eremiobacteraceae bacterium]|nr:isocitrate lyase/phosphoenolpyruvate mutase family protein [Candidatus Eremiobacteraceae bacterium]
MATSTSLRYLHRRDHILVLPNAWDPASAAVFETLGAEAIATTSAGFAWANGCSDGEILPRRMLLDGVAAIARVTKIPLTVDVEGGYSDDPVEVADLIRSLLGATRADGINIEDGDDAPALLENKIRAIRQTAEQCGADLFINARVDVYLKDLVDREHALEATLERAARYEVAGCDGIFVPGVSDAREIAAVVRSTALPVNVLAWPGLPTLDDLRKLGVRRLSAGSAIALRAFDFARTLGADFLARGAAAIPFETSILKSADLNSWMRMRRE